MLTSLRRRVPAVAAVLALIAAMAIATSVAAPAAHADPTTVCTPNPDGSQTCVIHGTQGGGNGGGKGDGTDINCDASGNIVYKGVTYRCDLGDWSFSAGCYITPVVPQPPTNDPIWGSDDPAAYRVQWEDCTHIPPTQTGAKEIIGPCVGYCAGPNPVELITNELQIAKPDLGMAPPGRPVDAAAGTPAKVGFVNDNVWFWSKGLDTSTQTRSAGNVVGTRTFVSANWTITKAGQSVPIATRACTSDNEYTPDKGSAPSPDPQCAFQFATPGTYTVSVTTSWTLVIAQNGVATAPQNITSTTNAVTIVINEDESTNG